MARAGLSAGALLIAAAFASGACNGWSSAGLSDAGTPAHELDAGVTSGPDAGETDDAGPAVDGGPSLDAGPADDAGPATDAGSASDAGPATDAGSASDAGVDAGCLRISIGIFGNPGADASSNFQQWLTTAGASVQRVQTTTTEPVTAATLAPYDVVILDWLTRDYTPTEAAVFAAWVTGGGGVVSMSGYDNNTTDDWHANSLLAPLEVAYSGPLLNGPVTDFAVHPITVGLMSVTFNGGYGISDLGGTASTRVPIAFLPSGAGTANVGYAVQMGTGRAFVWGDEWIEFDSQWSTLPEIQQLWVQVFAWISAQDRCGLRVGGP